MCANQNSSLLFSFLWSATKPNLSNWIVVPIFSFASSGSPRPFIILPSGIMISVGMLSAFAGSHWMNFVWMLLSGSSDRNENSRGCIRRTLSDSKFIRCISL